MSFWGGSQSQPAGLVVVAVVGADGAVVLVVVVVVVAAPAVTGARAAVTWGSGRLWLPC
jgi:Na+(H+)/acetate symporter ActP